MKARRFIWNYAMPMPCTTLSLKQAVGIPIQQLNFTRYVPLNKVQFCSKLILNLWPIKSLRSDKGRLYYIMTMIKSLGA